MTAVQEICDRHHLATVPAWESWPSGVSAGPGGSPAMLLVAPIVANGLNMAADLVAISSGMALLHGGSALLRAQVAGALTIVLLVLGSFARIALASGLLLSCRTLQAI